MAAYVAFAALLAKPAGVTVWAFYLFGDLFSTLMVATFFAFLSDSVSPKQARRLYGLIGLGGVAGGAFGSLMVRVWIERLSLTTWLWIAFAVAAVILALAALAGRCVPRREEDEAPAAAPTPSRAGSPALEGARLVARSRYLLAVAAIVVLYETVSTVVDFQFSTAVAHFVDGPAIRSHFATVFLITNVVSLLVQLFVTGTVMSRLGITAALLVLPLAVVSGVAAFAIMPMLWTGSLLNTVDNGLSYSVHQSAKEALYVPRARAEKYRAKAFIDMFVLRAGKATAVLLSLGMSALVGGFAGLRWLSLLVVVLTAAWIVCARYAGRRFGELERGVDGRPSRRRPATSAVPAPQL